MGYKFENDDDLFALLPKEEVPGMPARKSVGASGGWDEEPVVRKSRGASGDWGSEEPIEIIPAPMSLSAKAASKPSPATPAKSAPEATKPAPIPEPILKQMEATQPDLVARYREKMAAGNSEVKDAQDKQDLGSYGNILGKAFNDYNNSQKEDYRTNVTFDNFAGKMNKADRPEFDGSMADKLGQQGVDRATANRSQGEAEFMTGEKLADLQQSRTDAGTARDETARMKDPNSAESKAARDSLMQMAPKFAAGKDFSSLSAAQIEKIAPQAFSASQQMANQEFSSGESGKSRVFQASENEKNRTYNTAKDVAKAQKDALKEKAPTASQGAAAGYARRLEQSEGVFDQLSAGRYNRASASSSANSKLPNIAMTKENQQQEQAERNYINAVLRRESGAAISPSEFASAETQYFPRFGDSEEVLAQKKANRAQVGSNFSAEAGATAMSNVPLVKPESSKGTSGSFDWDAEDKRRGK